jgi:hypothetical protein
MNVLIFLGSTLAFSVLCFLEMFECGLTIALVFLTLAATVGYDACHKIILHNASGGTPTLPEPQKDP